MSADDTQLGITDTDRERIREFLQTPQRMSPETCAKVRQRAHDGDTPIEMADDDTEIQWSAGTIRHHARGDCSHKIDTTPVASPPRHTHPPLTAEECARIRRRRAAGVEVPTIADEMDCGASTINTHANGRCSHESAETNGGGSA
jgi:DNA-binding NarL/FixJ family response regulator